MEPTNLDMARTEMLDVLRAMLGRRRRRQRCRRCCCCRERTSCIVRVPMRRLLHLRSQARAQRVGLHVARHHRASIHLLYAGIHGEGCSRTLIEEARNECDLDNNSHAFWCCQRERSSASMDSCDKPTAPPCDPNASSVAIEVPVSLPHCMHCHQPARSIIPCPTIMVTKAKSCRNLLDDWLESTHLHPITPLFLGCRTMLT